ncbi:MAG: class I SAM-dependent methyltransferase [Planctomycetia bacterium]
METGTAGGVSSACLATAVAHRPESRVVTIDNGVFPDREPLWRLLPDSVRRIIEPRQADSIAGLKAALESAESYDAAFLNAVQTVEHVLHEFEYATRLVRPGGLILIHDAVMASGTVGTALTEISSMGYEVVRLGTAESGRRADAGIGMALVENRRRDSTPASASIGRRTPMNVNSIVKEAFSIGMAQIETEVLQLASFLSALRPRNVMEIGTDRGGLFYLLTRMASGTKVSLDLPGGPWGSIPSGEVEDRDRRILQWDDQIVLIRRDSHSDEAVEVLRSRTREPFDFLFIDGDHSLEGVVDDYTRYSPFVRKGGWIAFHDINDTPEHRSAGVHVGPFWNSLVGDKIEFNVGDVWAGIGLIRSS